eukprot:7972570-Pyramimonas_sp.AAC.1
MLHPLLELPRQSQGPFVPHPELPQDYVPVPSKLAHASLLLPLAIDVYCIRLLFTCPAATADDPLCGFTYNAADPDEGTEGDSELMALPKDRGIRRGEGE